MDLSWAPQDVVQHRLQQLNGLTHSHTPSFSLIRDKYVGTDLSWAPQDVVQHRLQQLNDLTHDLKIFYSAWDVVPTRDVAQGPCVAVCCSLLQCVAVCYMSHEVAQGPCVAVAVCGTVSVCCSVLSSCARSVYFCEMETRGVPVIVDVRCSVLQCVAELGVLQFALVCWLCVCESVLSVQVCVYV